MFFFCYYHYFCLIIPVIISDIASCLGSSQIASTSLLYIYITKLLMFGYTNKLFFVCHTTLMKCAHMLQPAPDKEGRTACMLAEVSSQISQSPSDRTCSYSVTIFKHFNHKMLPFWEALLSVHLKTSSSCTAPCLWQAKPSCYHILFFLERCTYKFFICYLTLCWNFFLKLRTVCFVLASI